MATPIRRPLLEGKTVERICFGIAALIVIGGVLFARC